MSWKVHQLFLDLFLAAGLVILSVKAIIKVLEVLLEPPVEVFHSWQL